MSRWAYPASKALQDCSFHGSLADYEAMKGIIEEEREEERMVGLIVGASFPRTLMVMGPLSPNAVVPRRYVRGVTTRRGTTTSPIRRKAQPVVHLENQPASAIADAQPLLIPSATDVSLVAPPAAQDPKTDQQVASSMPANILDQDWSEKYEQCPRWSTSWTAIHTHGDKGC